MTTLSLRVVLAEAARWRPEKIAVDRRCGTHQLRRPVVAGARKWPGRWPSSGVGPGDTVALMCPNVTDFPRCYYGIMAAGAVVVPVHLLLTADEVGLRAARQQRQGAALPQQSARRSGREPRLRPASRWWPPARCRPRSRPASPGWRTSGRPRRRCRTFVSRQAEDPSVIFYTSGTTGASKGAVLTQLNLVMNATVGVFDTLDTRPDDVGLGLPAAVPHVRPDGQHERLLPGRRRPLVLLPRFTGEAAIELMLAEGVERVPRRADDVHRAARRRRGPHRPAAAAAVRVRRRVAAHRGAAPVRGGVRHHDLRGLRAVGDLAVGHHQPAAVRHPAGTVGHPIWGVEVRDRPARDRRAHRAARPGRRARRDRHPRAQRVRRLPRPTRGHRGGPGGRLVPHRRPRPPRTTKASSPSSTGRRTW